MACFVIPYKYWWGVRRVLETFILFVYFNVFSMSLNACIFYLKFNMFWCVLLHTLHIQNKSMVYVYFSWHFRICFGNLSSSNIDIIVKHPNAALNECYLPWTDSESSQVSSYTITLLATTLNILQVSFSKFLCFVNLWCRICKRLIYL